MGASTWVPRGVTYTWQTLITTKDTAVLQVLTLFYCYYAYYEKSHIHYTQ